MSPSTGPTDVHPLPDARAGERVPLQPLPDPPTKDRNCARPVSDRAADQNLVPESPDEAEEGTAGGEGNQRTGKAVVCGSFVVVGNSEVIQVENML